MSIPALDIQYAPLTQADYENALALWQNCPGVGISEADQPHPFTMFLRRNPDTCFQAMYHGRMIGTVLAGSDGRRGYIYHLAVLMDYRRHGIGRTLLHMTLDALRAQGITKCHLMAFDANDTAKAFYTAEGWTYRHDIALFSRNL